MPSTGPVTPSTATRIARIPFLNAVPFFRSLGWEERYALVDCVPRELGQLAQAGDITAGLLPAADFFRLEKNFERLGHFGVAVRGRAHSVLLFSKKPMRQLDGATISVTEQSSTSVILLRLILEKKYHLTPAGYEPRQHEEKRHIIVTASKERRQESEADALLLIGNEALQFKQVNRQYPFETDLSFEWWLWQHQPFTFAVWAIRKDADEKDKKQIESGLARALSMNQKEFGIIANEWQEQLATPADVLQQYLESFIYRLGGAEEEGLQIFKGLVNEHHLL